jgi:peptidoglycan/xylan/chitin deacetylase (PgdA/CDA1 family)/GT2 family glycosyltransferase
MRLSVVIATHDRKDALAALLDALVRQDLAPWEFEVIVVVDGSTDGTSTMLQAVRAPFALRWLEQPNAGQASARNAGWQLAAAPLVLFLDDDLECGPDLLGRHVAAHDGCADRVVVGRVRSIPRARRAFAQDTIAAQLEEWALRLQVQAEMTWPRDAYVATNCSVPVALLRRVGGFDGAFFRALEDHDLGLRLWTCGASFVYAHDAVVTQRYVKSTADTVRDEQWYGRAEVLLARKHPDCLQHTLLARIAARQGWRRCALRWLARWPLLTWLCVAGPVMLLERLTATGRFAGAGRRLAAVWMHAARLRAGVAASGGWPAFDAMFAQRLAVLMYHHVGPALPGTYPDLTVAPAAFERHVAALARRGYRTISPAEYARVRRGEASLPRRAVMVTFDDGYADVVRYALPVLAKHGFGAVVFVVTGELAGTNSWDEVRGSATHRLLGCDDILAWRRFGTEFGGHSRTHASLPEVDDARLAAEVGGCRADLRTLTGADPVALAYPYGDLDDRVVAAAEREFELAFTTDEGLNGIGTDARRLRRTMVMPRDSALDVLLRARLGFGPRDVLLRWRAALLRPLRGARNRLVRGSAPGY